MSSGLDFAVGLLELGLALVVLVRLRRFLRALAGLVTITLFVALRGVDRIWAGFGGGMPQTLSLAVDGVLLLVLSLLLISLGGTLRGLR